MGAGGRRIRDIERASREELTKLQQAALTRLLDGLEDRSKFYRLKHMGQSKLVASAVKDFVSLPTLSKADLVAAQGLNPPWGGLLAVNPQACSIFGFTDPIAAGVEDFRELMIAATSEDMGHRVELAGRAFAAGGSG